MAKKLSDEGTHEGRTTSARGRRTVVLAVRVPHELVARIDRAARCERRTRADWCRIALEDALLNGGYVRWVNDAIDIYVEENSVPA